MKVTTNIKDKFAILKFEVDQILGYEAKEFQEALLNSLGKDSKFIIVNLSNIKYISSWGIGMLIQGLATTKNRGGEFRVACLAENVLQVLKKVKIDTVLNLYETVDLAIADS
jgi:anti-sigma B factor antagonist